MKLLKLVSVFIVFFFSAQIILAQGGYEDLLIKEVEVENPVYLPIVGIGAGYINYYGELQNDFKNLIQGTPSYRLNIFQYIDSKRHAWKANVNITFGNMSGYERSYADTSKNLNFETSLFNIGFNVEYAFGNIFQGKRNVRPFISLGAEYINMGSIKTDIKDKNGDRYIYYPDGTIRVGDRVVTRDYDYETNINDLTGLYGRPPKSFDKTTAAIVVDAGLDFKVSNRVALRLATSLHYTFSDDLDAISSENTSGRIGDSKMDMFSFTYVAMNIDLFSDAKTKMVESLFADVSGDFDVTWFIDTDNDGVLDMTDDCPNTPKGVAINDTTGCPYDDDNDGVPNYMDKEQFSNKGAIVDEFGAELSPNKIRESLFQDIPAVRRDELYMIPVGMGWSKYSEMTNVEMPEKYKKLDKDKDDYISFDELLDAINGFFDFDSDFSTDDIYDLNSFFFAQ